MTVALSGKSVQIKRLSTVMESVRQFEYLLPNGNRLQTQGRKIPVFPLCLASAQCSEITVARCGHGSFENNSITVIWNALDYLLPYQKNLVCGRIIGILGSVQSLRNWL